MASMCEKGDCGDCSDCDCVKSERPDDSFSVKVKDEPSAHVVCQRMLQELTSINFEVAEMKTEIEIRRLVQSALQARELAQNELEILRHCGAEHSPVASDHLTAHETVPVIRSLLRICENVSTRSNKIEVVRGMLEVLSGNPRLMQNYPTFSQAVKNKCLDFIQDHNLPVARQFYARFYGEDKAALEKAESLFEQGIKSKSYQHPVPAPAAVTTSNE